MDATPQCLRIEKADWLKKIKGTTLVECAVLLALIALICFLVYLASTAPSSMLAVDFPPQ